MDSKLHIELTKLFSAHNYAPLQVVLARGEGVWLWDVEGQRYLDMLSAYSAVNFGHSNPRFVKVAQEQLARLTITSRAFYNDQLGPFCQELAELCGMEMVLAMNSGAEAVETAIKCARKWGYEKKGVPTDRANIVVFKNNFAGRTTTIVSFSSHEGSYKNFGPLTPGFRMADFGDLASVEALIDANTVAVLFEPIQCEGGVIIPPDGFLKQLRALCSTQNVLMLADEIQTGLCRTGELFACDHEKVKPDMYIIGKSLGAGIVPISAVVSSRDILSVFTPGTHGSTFGGNPFACAIAREVLNYIKSEKPQKRAAELGAYFGAALRKIESKSLAAVRTRGLACGADIPAEIAPAKHFCKELKKLGLLCKDTHEQTIRFFPPLIIEKAELDYALERIEKVFR